MNKLRKYATKLAVIAFIGMNTLAQSAFAQSQDPGQMLGISGWKGDIAGLLKSVAGWLQYVLAAGTLAAIVFAIVHGVNIMKETDPRARQDRIKGLWGWVVGVIIMFAATTLTAVLHNLSSQLGGGGQ